MTLWTALLTEATELHTLLLVAGSLLTAAMIRAFAPLEERGSIRTILALTMLHVATLPVAAALRGGGSGGYTELRLLAQLFAALAVIQMAAAILFGVVMRVGRLRSPRIVRDVIAGAAMLVAVFTIAANAGFNLSGLVATSAVLTAVIGFSMQDTLGNLMAGLALQMDQSVEVGQWIRVGEITGKVIEIRWRYTAIETRNWETHLVPNTVMVKSQVQLIGKRRGQPEQWRRWVYFNVDFRYAPNEIIEIVERALQLGTIPAVAVQPAPNVVLMDLQESYGRYAVRYWLTDLAADDPTDSLVRIRVYFALKRAGIPLSIPAQALFVTEDNAERRSGKHDRELERRLKALSETVLFRSLAPADLETLAAGLQHAPFVKGETLTRQGADAHWLYLIVEGEAAVEIAVGDSPEQEVSRVGPRSFIGEMSLMTGEKRSATVVALSNVDCYRLDKVVFQEMIRNRPGLAEDIAGLLAERSKELAAARSALDREAAARRLEADAGHMLARIRQFFGLS